MASPGRRREADAFIHRTATWAASRPDLLAAALVGSWARGDARDDSDLDLILLTDEPSAYLDGTDWIDELAPRARLIRSANWGPITERRLLLPSSLEVEVDIGERSWAEVDPVDPGTRQVVHDGFRPLVDPHGLLSRLAACC